LLGGSGNDFVDGGSGPDKIVGAEGNDYVRDGERMGGATDILVGGEGNDVLDPINRPAKMDLVTCGGGFDRVLADRADVVAPDCERVFKGVASFDAFFNSIPQSYFENLHPQFTP